MARRKKKNKSVDAMPVINPGAAGIDLGGTSHWVCLPENCGMDEQVREFASDTPSLYELAACLKQAGVTTVAMESTNVYWIPLYEILDSQGFEVLLADTRSFSSVPGRKTDCLDCQWVQILHACGLLRGAFRPADDIVKFRALARMQTTLVDQAADWVRRIEKHLDMMNVRVHRAVSDITGATGMRMIRAIVDGERDPANLADLRDPRCKLSKKEIKRELTGNWREEHLFNLEMCLHTYDHLSESINRVKQQILDLLEKNRITTEAAPEPTRQSKARTMVKRDEEHLRQALYSITGVDLTRIDGVCVGVAQTMLSEIGPDVSMFPDEKAFTAYLRYAPNRPVTGGKVLRGKDKKKPLVGSSRAHQALKMAAFAVKNTDTALGAYYRSIAVRKSHGVAAFATARKIAHYIYRMLKFGSDYVDIGAQEYERRSRERRLRAVTARAQQLGYHLTPVEQTATA